MSLEKQNLLLIIGRPGSGKSKFLHNYSKEKGIPILNLDNILGKQIPEGKDANYIYNFIKGFLASYKQQEILIDKKTILYQKDTEIDLLDFLREISVDKTVITTWTGWTENGKLIHVCEELGTTIEYPLDQINCQYMELK